jgi:hypothetical protein
MKEPLSNIGMVCPEHSAKPDPQYFEKPYCWFFGKNCKLRFPTGLPEGKPQYEAMWVYVQGIREIDGTTWLVGVLNNDPIIVTEYKDGDGVAFERNEICAVS